MIVELTSFEMDLFNAADRHVRNQGRPEAERIRKEYVKNEAQKLVRNGKDLAQAEHIVNARCNGTLHPDDIIQFDDGTTATVEEIIAAPETYNGRTGPDPKEPGEGACKMKIFVNADGTVIVHSQLHGGINYFLKSHQQGPNALDRGEVSKPTDNWAFDDVEFYLNQVSRANLNSQCKTDLAQDIITFNDFNELERDLVRGFIKCSLGINKSALDSLYNRINKSDSQGDFRDSVTGRIKLYQK